jgi:L-lactate dehydrogenase complex protein LldG
MDSRETILSSIRQHLAASVPYDKLEPPAHPEPVAATAPATATSLSLVELFKQSLEAVEGHCVVAQTEDDVVRELTRIIGNRLRRVAISDSPAVHRLIHMTDLEVDEFAIVPDAREVFRFDVGITMAQAAIAETGTLVLDSSAERNRLVSLVPPVHIAIVNAASISQTLAEALAFIHTGGDISPAITFITGPSRTADIELTLAIGVHGPQELYVIISEGPPLSD